jgi:hypothetical protein
MTSEKPLNKTACLIRTRLTVAAVYDVALMKWLQNDTTRRTYLLFRDEVNQILGLPLTQRIPSAQGIISKLRDIYGPKGALFSVLSEKPGRVVICAWLSNETIQSESPPLSAGPAV